MKALIKEDNMRKFLVIGIPIVTIVLFLAVMLSGNYLKTTKVNNKNFTELVAIVEEDINNDRWEEAKLHSEELQETWDKLINRTQFSSERDEINQLNVCLARLKGAIKSNNKALAIDGLYEAYEHWDQLGN